MLLNVYLVNGDIISLMENAFKFVRTDTMLMLRYKSAKIAIFHVPSAVEVNLMTALSVMWVFFSLGKLVLKDALVLILKTQIIISVKVVIMDAKNAILEIKLIVLIV